MLFHKQITKPILEDLRDRRQSKNLFVLDELREDVFCQRVRHIESRLFDEYWEELSDYRKRLGATR